MENQLQLALSSRPTTSFTSLLESQKELFSSQIDQLQNIVAHQCNLTGVNPLSQETAAGALSIKIAGKRPRDLLNPKAIKYMQSVFSIKDAINKKETREISALFGVTVTQVRDFFTTQRTRVRKLLRLSREKASKSNASNEGHCETPLSSDPGLPTEPAPLDSVAPTCTEEGPSSSTQDEVLTGIDERERHFLDTIFTLMRKEETFSGQVKLMDGILEVQNPSVLHWFLTKGGVMILATWLSQAAIEEQTSVLHVILKVLCHLPLHQALPVHMSAILQSVNRLRFYRTSDISNRARILLAKWSKMFARSQALKKRNGIKSASDVQDELLLKQSIGEVMGNEIWSSKVDDFEVSHANLSETSEHLRKLDSSQPIKLLTASSDDPNKKLSRGVLASKTRERRKVQLMEQPSQRTAGRSLPVSRSIPANQARPLSADDIQKAKIRAQFMQSKYGKSNNDDSSQVKPEAPKRITSPEEGVKRITSPEEGVLNGALKLLNWPKLDEREKLDNVTLKRSNLEEGHRKLSLDVEEPPWKRCRRMQIPWQKPPEFKISDTWIIIAGDDSKEVDIQNNRIRRERETIYRTVQEIPLNPKEPWDIEMDPDDTLTIEIPIEQLPDPESAETVVTHVDKGKTEAAAASASTSSNQGATTIPDFVLLAELLKSPEMVFALTNLSSEETVKLLDMIKKNGVNSLNSLVGLGSNAEKKVEVSLPSPTPSSEPGPSGTKHDFTKNPFSQRSLMAVPDSYGAAQLAALVRSQENLQASSSMVQHQQQITSTTMLAPQQQLTITPQLAQQLSLLQAAASSGSFEQQQQHGGPSQINHSLNHTVLGNSLNAQLSASESSVNKSKYSVYGSTDYNLHGANAAAASRMYGETSGNIRSSPTPMSMQMQMPIANVQQRNINLPSPQMAVSPTPPRLHLQAQSQPGYVAEPWGGAMPGSYSNRGYQDNAIPNHYNPYVAGHVGHGTQQAVWRGNNNHMDEPGFESWSPDNSPVRHHQHVPTWNHAEPRMDMSNTNNYRQDRMNMNVDNNYRPDRSAAPQQHPGYYPGYRGRDAGGNGRWGERRR